MNKKLLALAATGLLCATGVSAHDFEVDGIYYNITSEEDKTVEVTYQGDNYGDIEEYSGAVSIPTTVTYDGQEYSVTSIGNEAFAYCYSLTSVQIPNSVTSIDSWAFESCYNLTYVSIPNSVNSIGAYAFYYCSSLTYVPIPDSVNSIDYQAFCGCSGLTLVVIPNSVTSIGGGAFSGCSNLSSLVVAPGNPVYDSREGCNAIIESASNTLIVGLASSAIPDGVTSIGSAAFQDCDYLTSIEIPNSVTNIGDYAFYGCDGLTSVDIPGSVTHIGDNAFQCCYNLSSLVVDADNPVYDSRGECNAIIESATNTLIVGCSSSIIPDGVTSIGDYAFNDCDGLTSVTIPNSVTNIGDNAFYGCDGLTSVDIPGSVTHIGDNAFSGCSNLSSLVVAADNPVYDSRGGCNAIIEKSSNTLIVGCQSTTIPNGVTRIENNAFCYCDRLTAVNIPNTVTSIGHGAFSYCGGLTSVEIPNSVTNIEYDAFYCCTDLASVVIPNSVTSIESWAFQSCYNLTSVTSKIPADRLFSISTNVFDGVDKTNCTLNVPYGAQATYAYTEGWEDFENIVEMDPPSFDLTVSSAGYATLYLDYTAQIPEGVSVYTANEVEGNLLKMELVEGLLPANTGVVVKAPAGTYTFTYSDTYAPEISDNLFKGSATYEYVDVASTQTAFVLSKVDGEVGMYPAKLTDGRFLNNANKAYLLLTTKLGVSDDELDTSVGGAQLSLRFYFGSTTGVDKVQTESSADAVIYDLYGRKVNKATTPGFYIINNKKVWVK